MYCWFQIIKIRVWSIHYQVSAWVVIAMCAIMFGIMISLCLVRHMMRCRLSRMSVNISFSDFSEEMVMLPGDSYSGLTTRSVNILMWHNRYAENMSHNVHRFVCFFLSYCRSQWIQAMFLLISFNVSPLGLWQLYNCPNASDICIT